MAAALGAYARARYERLRRKSPEELERIRRLSVNRCGRIALAKVVDFIEATDAEATSRLVLYRYEVAAVTYEAAQEVSPMGRAMTAVRFLSGRTASIKFDPKKPSNSIIVCEEWCGVPQAEPLAAPDAEHLQKPSEALG